MLGEYMFKEFKQKVDSQAQGLMKLPILYRANVLGDELWETFISSFPEEVRQQFRCNTCKQFIKGVGNLVHVDEDLNVRTIWDVYELDPVQQRVAESLRTLVMSRGISSRFYAPSERPTYGCDSNKVHMGDAIITWEHFHVRTPLKHISGDLSGVLNTTRNAYATLKRALDTLTLEAIETTLQKVRCNELYRGEQYRDALTKFITLKQEYETIPDTAKDLYVWYHSARVGPLVYGIRNSAVGQLLQALSEGEPWENAVRSYEGMVAPDRYRRASSGVRSESELQRARKTIQELGLELALERRYATQDDIPLQGCFFVDRASARPNDVFALMSKDVLAKPKEEGFENLPPVGIEEFIKDVLPGTDSMEIYLGYLQTRNLMTLTTCVHDTEPLFGWGNNVGWCYVDALADSNIRQKVKQAGGSVEGKLRNSLHWYNHDDLDIHLEDPYEHISFSNKRGRYGRLDVDMNVSGPIRGAVENITYDNQVPEGIYNLYIHNFTKRESTHVGFEVEVEFSGIIYHFAYTQPVVNNVPVAKYRIANNQIEFLEGKPNSEPKGRTTWGLGVNKFHPVTLGLRSPNYWGNKGYGNKHYFFLLKDAIPEGKVRSIFNEFLRPELVQHHRQVFEVVGDRLELEGKPSIGGLGFSVGSKGEFVCRLKGEKGYRLVRVIA